MTAQPSLSSARPDLRAVALGVAATCCERLSKPTSSRPGPNPYPALPRGLEPTRQPLPADTSVRGPEAPASKPGLALSASLGYVHEQALASTRASLGLRAQQVWASREGRAGSMLNLLRFVIIPTGGNENG